MRFLRVGGTCRDRVESEEFGVEFAPHDDDVMFVLDSPVPTDQVVGVARAEFEAQGFKVFTSDDKTLTIRAKVPEHMRGQFFTDTVDFAHAREESSESNGRKPEEVWAVFGDDAEERDLARRDFTIGAIAEKLGGARFDPFDGARDVRSRTLRFVGEAQGKSEKRIQEDGLRVLRGLRFMVTKNLTPTRDCWAALTSDTAVGVVGSDAVSTDRIRAELATAFQHNTIRALGVVTDAIRANAALGDAIFKNGLHLDSCTKQH